MFQNAQEVIFQVTRVDVLWFLLAFLLIINVVAISLAFFDKKLAKTDKQRIPEKTLFLVAFLGGAIGEYLVMLKIRHKTLHKRFMIGLPVIFTAQAIAFIWWLANWFN